MSTRNRTHIGATTDPGWLRTITTAVGAVFLLVGVLGFIPGITTNYGDLLFAGHMSDAKLLGVFEVSVLHNVVHLLFGIVGILAARNGAVTSAWYLLIGGLVYAALWIYGLAVDEGSQANFVPLNSADNWLHLVLAVAMIVLGAVGLRQVRGTVTTTRTTL